MTSNRKRLLSLIVLMVFSFVIFSSALFIIVHTNHDCVGEECPICTELAECHKNLNTSVSLGGIAISLTALHLVALILEKLILPSHYDHTTLISLKVELLN